MAIAATRFGRFGRRGTAMPRASDVPAFASLLRHYFCQRPIAQRDAGPRLWRATETRFRLLLGYTLDRMRKKPTELALVDIDAPFVLGFLAHLERDRGNCPRTRNARFAALRPSPSIGRASSTRATSPTSRR
jgi:integrase/recombinase XerD